MPLPSLCADEKPCPVSGHACPGHCVYADVMASANLGILVIDVSARRLEFANDAAREVFRRLDVPLECEALSRLFIPDGLDVATLEAPYAPEPLHIGSRLVGFTLYRSRQFAWIFLRDVTEKARLESIAEAVETMNNIGFVFSALRHELGNPVNSVKTAISVLRENVNEYPRETIAEYLDRISSEVGRIEGLLRSLKSFSMYDRFEIRPVELPALLEGFSRLVRTDAERSGVEVEVDAEPGRALCDPRALQQVLLNLFANAVHAARQTPNPRVVLRASSSEDLVWLRVEDNGPGLTPEQKQGLFKPFFTSKEHGTGLGLVISRKLLARMSGTIELDSGPSGGAVATITLPVARP